MFDRMEAIGLLPTYPQVGMLAPVLLVLMRIIQGTALGGMYGGAVIYVAEHARPDRRATATIAPDLTPVGMLTAQWSVGITML